MQFLYLTMKKCMTGLLYTVLIITLYAYIPSSLLLLLLLVVDFFNRINLIYGTVSEFCTDVTCPVMSGGPKLVVYTRCCYCLVNICLLFTNCLL